MRHDIIVGKNLTFAYNGTIALEDISFSIQEGDFVGILGPNGSGKTTLAKILVGLLPLQKGEVTLFDRPLHELDDWKRIGYVPQQIEVDRNFPATVRELFSSLAPKIPQKKIIKALELRSFLDSKFLSLSGGQKQRVITALAMVKNPALLILDEPSVGVDVKVQEKFYRFLKDVNKQGVTILLVTHDIGMVSRHTRSVLCINRSQCCQGAVSKTHQLLEQVYGKEFRHHRHQRRRPV